MTILNHLDEIRERENKAVSEKLAEWASANLSNLPGGITYKVGGRSCWIYGKAPCNIDSQALISWSYYPGRGMRKDIQFRINWYIQDQFIPSEGVHTYTDHLFAEFINYLNKST